MCVHYDLEWEEFELRSNKYTDHPVDLAKKNKKKGEIKMQIGRKYR